MISDIERLWKDVYKDVLSVFYELVHVNGKCQVVGPLSEMDT